MSRTIKDLKQNKVSASSKKKEMLKNSYCRARLDGFVTRIHDEDYCPDCGGLTNFQNGFLTCCECSWSTFETEEISFNGFEIKAAI
jgi:hypothetical protein